MRATGERFIPDQFGQIALEHLNRYHFVINQLDLTDKIIIDLASGEGYGSNLLANYAKKVYGIDISFDAIEHSKHKYRRDNLEFLVGNAINIPLPNKIADIFICFETIEHIERHFELIKEIKRVLKPNGILFISTPDKYYYSDLPKYNNEFHIKELYNYEFKELLTTNFKKAIYFLQRTFSGSIIVQEEESVQYKKPLMINKLGERSTFTPIYNIAVVSDNELLNIEYPLVFYHTIDGILTEADLNNEYQIAQQIIRSSISYKIGHTIVSPVKQFLSLFK